MTGRPLGKTFFLHCQRRHPELPKTPTYLPQCAWELLEDRGIADRSVILCQEGQDLLELLQGSHIEQGVQLRRQVVRKRVHVSVENATKLAEQ